MSFEDDMRRATNRIIESHHKIARTAALDLFSGTVKSTPVDTGAARGNWQTSVGQAKQDQTDRLDQGGAAAIAEIEAVTPPGAGQEVFLTNNLPYIDALENGSSTQAPVGLVKINFDRVKRIVDAAVKKHRV